MSSQTTRHVSGHEMYCMWVNAPGSDLNAYWLKMNPLEKAKWDALAKTFNRLRDQARDAYTQGFNEGQRGD